VADVNGVTYINDSREPTSARRIAAVRGMTGPLIIIAGGDGKNSGFLPIGGRGSRKVRHTVLIAVTRMPSPAALHG